MKQICSVEHAQGVVANPFLFIVGRVELSISDLILLG